MLTLKRLLVIVTTLLCALSIAACSGTSGTNAQAAGKNNNNNNKQQNSSSVDTSSNDNYSNNNSSSNSNSSSGTNTLIKVAQISINGQMTNILTASNGMTLYYDANDTAMNATCTGGCAQTWHPLLAQGQIITSNSITSGQITTQSTANGNQVEYNGHPLYTYVNDTAGQVT